jgi:hypothetical protein
MICSEKLIVTHDLCVEQKEEFKFTLDERPKHIHKKQTHLLLREDVA